MLTASIHTPMMIPQESTRVSAPLEFVSKGIHEAYYSRDLETQILFRVHERSA